jgi:hypothetical protein
MCASMAKFDRIAQTRTRKTSFSISDRFLFKRNRYFTAIFGMHSSLIYKVFKFLYLVFHPKNFRYPSYYVAQYIR